MAPLNDETMVVTVTSNESESNAASNVKPLLPPLTSPKEESDPLKLSDEEVNAPAAVDADSTVDSSLDATVETRDGAAEETREAVEEEGVIGSTLGWMACCGPFDLFGTEAKKQQSATKIQAVGRGFSARSEAKKIREEQKAAEEAAEKAKKEEEEARLLQEQKEAEEKAAAEEEAAHIKAEEEKAAAEKAAKEAELAAAEEARLLAEENAARRAAYEARQKEKKTFKHKSKVAWNAFIGKKSTKKSTLNNKRR